LPGNHDWYDGLTSFMRMFAQGAALGGWQTVQSRSYFAVQLQAGWWLVGLDSQLGEYIDRPQLDYFELAISAKLQPGDSIILCTASPTWETTVEDPDAFNTLDFFENGYLRNRRNHTTGALEATGATVRLWISGDHHHYDRYCERPPGSPPDSVGGQDPQPDPRCAQMVTCGLGGAYLMGTDRLGLELTLPPELSRMHTKSPVPTMFTRAATVFPDGTASRTLYLQLLNPFSRYWLPIRNSWFSFGLGMIHMLLFSILAALLGATKELSMAAAIRTGTIVDALAMSGWAFGVPLLVFVLYRVGFALVIENAPPRRWQVLLAVVVQLLVAAGIFILVVTIPGMAALPVGLVLFIVAVAGGAAGSEAFAIFLVLVPPGTIGDFKMTGLAYEDGKGFVRMHLSPEGVLTLYPLLVDTVVHDWNILPGDGDGIPARPVAAAGLPRMRLLEEPVVIAKNGFTGKEKI
jgi:hypothetical protein